MAAALKVFKENIAKWLPICPDAALALKELNCQRVFIVPSGGGPPNLAEKKGDGEELFYSPEGGQREAECWFSSLDLSGVTTLVVYGVGLGYYYLAVRQWLREDKQRGLVFIEDDLEVVHRLFETDLGSEILADRQTVLLFIKDIISSDVSGSKSDPSLPLQYFHGELLLSSLKRYSAVRRDELLFLQIRLDSMKDIELFQTMEFIYYGAPFFSNFYRNLFKLPGSYSSYCLRDKFKDIPAVICGAGPSLDKNIDLLKKARNKALIFAGGSAINALGAVDLDPHFLLSVDPNPAQYSRFMMNKAFNIPLLYSNRAYSPIVDINQGDHVYVSGGGPYKIATWFEKSLGIAGEKDINQGHNVVNLSLSLASFFGCNPIILVGVDLAFYEGKDYASGIFPYPLLDIEKEPSARRSEEKILGVMDINGQKALTLWKWVNESKWITNFAMRNPLRKIINATEGGIGFDAVPNIKFATVSKNYFLKELDMEALVHGAIQNCRLPAEVSAEKIEEKLRELLDSLQRCRDLCKTLSRQFLHVLYSMIGKNESPEQLITDFALESLKKLNDEVAYKSIIKDFSEPFSKFFGERELKRGIGEGLEFIETLAMDKRRAIFNKRKYEFFGAVIGENMTRANYALYEHMVRKAISAPSSDKVADVEKLFSDDKDVTLKPVHRYKEEDCKKMLETSGDGKYEILYDNGRVKYTCCYKNKKLCGPSLFYSPEGKILAKSLFKSGKIKAAATFYNSGRPHSVKRYKNALLDGEQLFFHESGALKSRLFYKKGKLDGRVEQYYPDGRLMRLIHFKKGKREGVEKKWYMGGIKEAHIEYRNNRPINVARGWYINGRPAREIVFDKDFRPVSLREWLSSGKPVANKILENDYFHKVGEYTERLTDTLESMEKRADSVLKDISLKEASQDLQADFDELRREMANLKSYQKDIDKQIKDIPKESKDVIWQSEEARRILKNQVEKTRGRLMDNLKSVEEAFGIMLTILGKKNRRKK